MNLFCENCGWEGTVTEANYFCTSTGIYICPECSSILIIDEENKEIDKND